MIVGIFIMLQVFKLNKYVVLDTIPIDTYGLISCDTSKTFYESMNAAKRYIALNNTITLFSKEKYFEISAKMRKIIHAYSSHKDFDIGKYHCKNGPKNIFLNFYSNKSRR
jgi:hypothetical protein